MPVVYHSSDDPVFVDQIVAAVGASIATPPPSERSLARWDDEGGTPLASENDGLEAGRSPPLGEPPAAEASDGC